MIKIAMMLGLLLSAAAALADAFYIGHPKLTFSGHSVEITGDGGRMVSLANVAVPENNPALEAEAAAMVDYGNANLACRDGADAVGATVSECFLLGGADGNAIQPSLNTRINDLVESAHIAPALLTDPPCAKDCE